MEAGSGDGAAAELELVAATLGAGPAAAVLSRLLAARGVDGGAAGTAYLRPLLATGLRAPEAFPDVSPAALALADAAAHGGVLSIVMDGGVDAQLAAVLLHQELPAFGIACRWHEDGATDGAVIHVGFAPPASPCGAGIELRRDGHAESVWLSPGAWRPRLSLCGAVWYLLLALRSAWRREGRSVEGDLRAALDLVALGTIAAQVPLVGENRVLVSVGLVRLRDGRRPPLRALLEAGGVHTVSVTAVSARVLPRLDAASACARLAPLLAISEMGEARAAVAALELGRAAGASAGRQVSLGGPASIAEVEVSLADLTPRFVGGLGLLEPCGPGNPRPVLGARGARVEGVRLVGDPEAPRAKVRIRQGGRTIPGFARGEVIERLLPGTVVDLTFHASVAEVDGRQRVEIELLTVSDGDSVAYAIENADENDFLDAR